MRVAEVTNCATLRDHLGGCDALLPDDTKVSDHCCATCSGASGADGAATTAPAACVDKDTEVKKVAEEMRVAEVTNCATLQDYLGGCDAELPDNSKVSDHCCATCSGASGAGGAGGATTTPAGGCVDDDAAIAEAAGHDVVDEVINCKALVEHLSMGGGPGCAFTFPDGSTANEHCACTCPNTNGVG